MLLHWETLQRLYSGYIGVYGGYIGFWVLGCYIGETLYPLCDLICAPILGKPIISFIYPFG